MNDQVRGPTLAELDDRPVLELSRLHEADWVDAIEEKHLARGRSYAKLGLVRLVQVSEEEIDARCHGGAERPYRQLIRLQPADGRWKVRGRCNCPVGQNCKHVVAVLLTVEALQHEGDPRALPVRMPPTEPEQLIEDLAPQALLRLGSHRRVQFDARSQRMFEQTRHRAALAFLYNGHEASERGAGSLLARGANGQRLHIRRQPQAEAALRDQLLTLGLKPALRRSDALPESAGEAFELRDQAAWLHLVEEELPRLREQGWQIEMAPDFHFNLLPVQRWLAELEERDGGDWFDLELGILVEGRRVSLLPLLLQVLRYGPAPGEPRHWSRRDDHELLLIELPDGSGRVGLPYGRLRPLLQLLSELGEPRGSQLRLGRADLPRLQALWDQPMDWQGERPARQLVEQLQAAAARIAPSPPGLQAQLRDYQGRGLAWMQALRELRLGGVLADDMGLGKTLQTLAYLLTEKHAGRLTEPALVVMPTSLIGNWQEEARRFAPGLRVLVLHGPDRQAEFAQLVDADLILTSYALLPRDLPVLARQRFSVLILDEAQTIKNPRGKAASAARSLHARQRLCLTGTPLENHLGELWSLFHFLMPGWLGDQTSFARHYRQPIERDGDRQRLAELSARVQPFLLRRRKEDVARELPPKSEIVQWVELTQPQRDHYEALRLSMDDRLRAVIRRQGLASSQLLILEALLRLRQACCDLRLLPDAPPSGPQHSAKLVTLLEMLDRLLAEGRRVLVFSQFASMLELIGQELRRRRISFASLTGATRDRQAQIRAFQEGDKPLFLISLKAGGTGLNLTAADTVIHFDPWWNPAVEAQASDRAYRIGQDKPVFVYRLIARGSVEEKIQRLQQDKAELARDLLEGGSGWSLQAQDLDQLLAPLD